MCPVAGIYFGSVGICRVMIVRMVGPNNYSTWISYVCLIALFRIRVSVFLGDDEATGHDGVRRLRSASLVIAGSHCQSVRSLDFREK